MSVGENTHSGGKPTKIFMLSLNMAKELSMLEKNEKGKQARQYFIWCENKLREVLVEKQNQPKLPDLSTHQSTLRELSRVSSELSMVSSQYADEIDAHEKTKLFLNKAIDTIEEQRPKVDAYDKFIDTKNLINMANAAKTLKIKEVGRNKLYAILRDKEIIDKNNIPYQQYINKNYFEVKQTYLRNLDIYISTTYVTPKGLDYIRKIVE